MRRLALLALTALIALPPAAAHAQYEGGGRRQAEDDAAAQADADKKKNRDREWSDSQAPLPELRNAGPCPFVKALYDASRYVELKNNTEVSSSAGFTGEIQSISAVCEYKDDQPIKVEMNVLFQLGRGPQAEGGSKTYHYWVAVTDRNRDVIAKQTFDLPVTFEAGKDRIYVTDKVGSIVIPRGSATTSGANFEVLIGFDVTPEMAAFNRAGKRFRVNAGSAAVAEGSTNRQ